MGKAGLTHFIELLRVWENLARNRKKKKSHVYENNDKNTHNKPKILFRKGDLIILLFG